ncbi:MAG: flagellar export chaperone FliS [Syntrophales bacterium]
MYTESAAKSYKRTNYLSADPLKLVRMCYEGAISNLKAARDAYIERDYEAKAKALIKTLDIIHELNAALDMERGGDIARNLRSLYLYIQQTLMEADLKRNLTVFDTVIHMLEELESAWQELAFGNPETITSPPSVVPYEVKKMTPAGGATVWSA